MTAARSSPHPYTQFQGPMVFAHRGGAQLAPENTLAAFTMARDLGVDALEIDIWPTAEGEAVVFHDATLERTTDGHGYLNQLPLTRLRQLDAGYRFTRDGESFPFRDRGIRIPTLLEVLETFPDLRINIELKGTRGGFEARVRELIESLGARDRVLVCSGIGWINDRVRERIPGVAHGASPWEVFRFWISARMGWEPPPLPAHAMQVPHFWHGLTVPSEPVIERARTRDIAIHVWTIDAEEEMIDLLDRGVDGLMSDRPDLLLKVRDRRSSSRTASGQAWTPTGYTPHDHRPGRTRVR